MTTPPHPATPPQPAPAPIRRDAVTWIALAVAAGGILLCLWVALTAWGGVVHGHPAYAIVLAVTVILSAVAIWRALRRGDQPRRGGWRRVGRIALIALALAGLAAVAWLRPYTAVEPALAAMVSDESVVVAESPTEIVFTPADADPATPGIFFQPGALVDPRAYAAMLRPLAEDGHTVVIAKQPLSIAFLALGALDAARVAHPEVSEWVIGGHSLGGTVAAIQATTPAPDDVAPVSGLLFFASYPAGDIRDTLQVPVASISGTRDGLATPDKIEASRANLPPSAEFTVIEGASHAQFGSYGPQAGDGTPAISDDEARERIVDAVRSFLADR